MRSVFSCFGCVGVLLLCSGSVLSQGTITLRAAVDSALKNNRLLRTHEIREGYVKQMQGAAFDLPQTFVVGEIGQVNSRYCDTKFTIGQNFKFPSFYSRQRDLAPAEHEGSKLATQQKASELKAEVITSFCELSKLLGEELIYARIDSLFSAIAMPTAGAVDDAALLEQLAWENQKAKFRTEQAALTHDIAISRTEFKVLLNTPLDYVPIVPGAGWIPNLDSAIVRVHPIIQQQRNKTAMSEARYRMERSRLLPELMVAYSNMSMYGTGADNVRYGYNARFQSIQAGIGIPLFFGAQRARIRAQKLNMQESDNELLVTLQDLYSDYGTAVIALQRKKEHIDYYEHTALKNTELALAAASRLLANHRMKMRDWLQHLEDYRNARLEYEEVKKDYLQNLAMLILYYGDD